MFSRQWAQAIRLVPGAVALAACATAVQAQDRPVLTPERLQRAVNGVLSLMTYTVAPDVTTSSLSITDAASGNPGLSFTQFGGGFVLGDDWRLYLEGNASYARYDPKYILSDGTEQREVPTRWNSVSATGGVGWDFPISNEKSCCRMMTKMKA